MFLIPNNFGPKFLFELSYDLHNIHAQKHIPDRLKKKLKICFDQNILGPKFLFDLSYDSHNIHVQNTFLTDSKQIQKILENYFRRQYFGPKMLLVPNIF